METFRHTPVDKKMPVRTYERLSQVVSHLLQPNGRILVVSEWGGRSVKVCTEITEFCCITVALVPSRLR